MKLDICMQNVNITCCNDNKIETLYIFILFKTKQSFGLQSINMRNIHLRFYAVFVKSLDIDKYSENI